MDSAPAVVAALPAPNPSPARITLGRQRNVRPRSRRGQGESLRQEILDAADTLLCKYGHDGAVSVRAVASLVGCTPPALYLHFDDRTQLLFEVCARRFRELNDAVNAAENEPADDPLDVLIARSMAYSRFGLRHPEHYRILFMGKAVLTPEQWEDLRMAGVAGIEELVDRCQKVIDAGYVRPDAVPNARSMAYALWGIGHGIVSLMIAKPGIAWPPIEETLGHMFGAYAAGIRSQPQT